MLDGDIVLTAVVTDQAEVRVDDQRGGVELQRALDGVARVVEAPHRRQVDGVPVVRGLVARVEGDGSLEIALGVGELPVVIEMDVTQ